MFIFFINAPKAVVWIQGMQKAFTSIYSVDLYTYIFYYIPFFPPNYLFKNFHMYRKVARFHWMFTIPSPRCTILPLLAHLWALSLSKLCICHWIFGEFVVAVTAFHHSFSKYLLRTRMFFPHNHSTNNMLMQYCYLKCSLYFKFSLPITSVKGASIFFGIQ